MNPDTLFSGIMLFITITMSILASALLLNSFDDLNISGLINEINHLITAYQKT